MAFKEEGLRAAMDTSTVKGRAKNGLAMQDYLERKLRIADVNNHPIFFVNSQPSAKTLSNFSCMFLNPIDIFTI